MVYSKRCLRKYYSKVSEGLSNDDTLKLEQIIKDLTQCSWNRIIVSTCKIMTSGFFFQIGIIQWLISATVAPLKSCTFTKQFLLKFFLSIPVMLESLTITQLPAGHVWGGVINDIIFIRNFISCCFRKKIELLTLTAQKMKFAIKNFSSKCDQIRRKLKIWLHLLEKSLMEKLIFCAVALVICGQLHLREACLVQRRMQDCCKIQNGAFCDNS